MNLQARDNTVSCGVVFGHCINIMPLSPHYQPLRTIEDVKAKVIEIRRPNVNLVLTCLWVSSESEVDPRTDKQKL